jgi:hypothetical protein
MYRRTNLTYRILDSFFRHRLIFFLSVLGVTTVVSAVLFTRSKGYVGKASLYAITDNELNKALGFERQNTWVSEAQINANKLSDRLRDDQPGGFLDQFLKMANLKNPIRVDPERPDPRLDAVRKNLAVFVDSNNVFSMMLTWEDADECKRILKALQIHYMDVVGEDRQAQSIASKSFLQSKIADIRLKLDAADRALTAFKQKHAGLLPEATSAEIQRYSELKLRLEELQSLAKTDRIAAAQIQSRLNEIKPDMMTSREVTTSLLEYQFANLIKQRSDLVIQGWEPTSQRVATIDDQIKDLRLRMDEQSKAAAKKGLPAVGTVSKTKIETNPEYLQLRTQLTTSRIQDMSRQDQIRQLTQQLAVYDRRIKQMPDDLRQLSLHTRNYDFYKKKEAEYAEQLEKVNLKAGVERVTASAQIMPIGAVSTEPTAGPKKQAIMVVASLILGLIVGTLLVVLKEWLDPTFRYEMDAERLLGLPVLAGLTESAAVLALPAPSQRMPAPRASGKTEKV